MASSRTARVPAVQSTALSSAPYPAEPIGGVVHVVQRRDPARGRDCPSEPGGRDLPHPSSGRQQGTQVHLGHEVSNAALGGRAVGGPSIS